MASKDYEYKIFIREQGCHEPSTAKAKPPICTRMTGEEAESFYQEIINSTSIAPVPQKKKTRKKLIKRRPKPRINSGNLFKSAQENNVGGLKALIENGADVNSVDEFGWSSLMCAVCNNSEAAVEYLLREGADLSICDKGGYGAVALAREHGNERILNMLLYRTSLCARTNVERIRDDTEEHCGVCKGKYSGSREKHEASTVHLIAANASHPSRTYYGIPESNKGFQLLMQQGWDRERGLGPDGCGRKFPIKVNKKADRSGVGAVEQKKAKSGETLSRPFTRGNASSQRSMERKFRMEFS